MQLNYAAVSHVHLGSVLTLTTYPADNGAAEMTAAGCVESVASMQSLAALAGVNGSPTDATLWSSVMSVSSTFALSEVSSAVAITSVLLLLLVLDGRKSSDPLEVVAVLGEDCFAAFCIRIYRTP